ncbi:hypothetical protein CCUS01_13385 [Colletotrichum cuscutae]|uniref:Uncharacterized protein n=1 Tax=Colletotrichum cuscutae TaxID=1209917 RepID=A0AAI9YBW3_9PEZI|nr:hypothetical protein CCUS01_13385 [Colletotrichum cuscutae]
MSESSSRNSVEKASILAHTVLELTSYFTIVLTMNTAFADALGVSGTWNPQTKVSAGAPKPSTDEGHLVELWSVSAFFECKKLHVQRNPLLSNDEAKWGIDRNATLGFYYALKILGYKPYHQLEVFKNGVPHVRMMNDAVRANSQGIGKPFTREDFDKFLGDFNAITDIPAWFLEDLVQPTQTPSLSSRSVILRRGGSPWPRLSSHWANFGCRLFVYVLYGGYLGPDKQKAQREAVKVYERHNRMVRELIPADKLLVIKPEEGLGWDKICPFLGHDIPDVPYPRVNKAAEFQVMVMKDMIASWKKTALKVGSFLVPLVGASIWLLR